MSFFLFYIFQGLGLRINILDLGYCAKWSLLPFHLKKRKKRRFKWLTFCETCKSSFLFRQRCTGVRKEHFCHKRHKWHPFCTKGVSYLFIFLKRLTWPIPSKKGVCNGFRKYRENWAILSDKIGGCYRLGEDMMD